MVKAIIKANANLKESTSNGDLEMMGKDVKRLQELIDKLDKVVADEEKTKNKNKNQNVTNTISNTITNSIDSNEM